MSWSSCPFCSRQVLSIELERHANNHFEDEDLARDIQLAHDYEDEDIDLDLAHHVEVSSSQVEIPRKPESVSCSESEAKYGFMGLLKNCLECDGGVSILCGYVDHFQSTEFEDVGWGCGWRNIQMLSSHLLVQRQEAREALYGGGGFVPDILSLQRWLEIAWEKGFDTAGSNDFDQKIYGKRTWIGTTECAALFRSFGLRARIVDFSSSNRDAGSIKSQVTGPMDTYLTGKLPDNNFGICPAIVKGHQLLANWVWSYFSDNMLTKSGRNRVVVAEKAPLYFQHDGHSRTIVGIQLKSLPNGMQQHNLLIFDPAHKTKVLQSCLSKKVGWQRYIKRGVHTLKKLDYQLCYMDPGIATGAELEKLKTLDSTRFEF
ncbi:hypothetical protein L2E82_31497 [Cichorium intybus]|uniref:Uncharacterized protein n=1 Tax=Cichorium intybus TaxID=13427 RepID=A0ACB9BEW7_CICIN|nr:hypothetical protein L2E82_31497 [Cichorium intybus]